VLFSLIFLFPQLAHGADFKIVIRVVSGDTIIVDGGQAVRLIGVLAPKNEEANEKAKEFLEKQLLAKEVDLLNDNVNNGIGHTDQYGRRLAYVYKTSDNLFLNREVIRRGLCFYSSKRIQKQATSFLLEQQEARKAKLGVWESTPYSPEEQADLLKQPFQEPAFTLGEDDTLADIRVKILWAKKANPKNPIVSSKEESDFLLEIFNSLDFSEGAFPLSLQLRKILASGLTKHYQEKTQGALSIETEGESAEILKFIAKGMDQSDADTFCSISINRELFAGLEFKQVVFTDGDKFSYTYKVK
jgi:endonuclease YncB( thermonuclease family)